MGMNPVIMLQTPYVRYFNTIAILDNQVRMQ
jgi:hypothetical protein